MGTNTLDAEIRKFLPLLGNAEKQSLLDKIKSWILKPTVSKSDNNTPKSSSIDYDQYHFPVSSIKFDRN